MPWFVAWDFPLYYSAGRLAPHEMYKTEVQQADQQRIYEENIRPRRTYFFAIYLRPAVYRLVLTPLAQLPFWYAYMLWATLQAAGILVGLYLYSRPLGIPPYFWILLPMCPPVISTVAWGQDAGLVFLAIAGAWSLSHRERWFAAGAVLALSLVKWNLFLLLIPLMVAQRKWRMLSGFTAVATLGAVASVAIAGWEGTAEYVQLLQHRDADVHAAQMSSMRGLLVLLGAPAAPVAAALVTLNCLLWWMLSRLDWRYAFAVAVTGCVSLSFHTMHYDSIFVLAPLLLLRDDLYLTSLPFQILFLLWMTPSPDFGLLKTLLITAPQFVVFACGLRVMRRMSIQATSSP